jgi:hypothetical protein
MFLQRFQTLGHHTDHTPRTDPTRSVGLRLGQRGIIIGRNRVSYKTSKSPKMGGQVKIETAKTEWTPNI